MEHPHYHGDEAAHTTFESCENKGRAFWWLLARIAGWDGANINPPAAPQLTVTTTDLNVSVFWNVVTNATGYNLFYAPYPYAGLATIKSVNMGTQTNISVNLSQGAAFFRGCSSV